MEIKCYSMLYPGHPEKHKSLLEFGTDAEAIREAKAAGAILIKHTGHKDNSLSEFGVVGISGILKTDILYLPWDK